MKLEEAHAKLAAAVAEIRASGIDVWGWDDGSIQLSDGKTDMEVEYEELAGGGYS